MPSELPRLWESNQNYSITAGGSFIIMKRFALGGVYEDYHSDIVQSLHPGEKILLRAQQGRLFKNLFNPDNFYITTSKIVLRKTRFFGLFPETISIPLFEILSVMRERKLLYSNLMVELRFKDMLIGIENISHMAAAQAEKFIRYPFAAERINSNALSPLQDSDAKTSKLIAAPKSFSV